MKNFKNQITTRLNELDASEYVITDVNESKTSEYLYITNTKTGEEFSIRISNHDAICSRSKIAKHEVVYNLCNGIYYINLNSEADNLSDICEENEIDEDLFSIEEFGYNQVELNFTDFYKGIAQIITSKIIWN